MNTVKVYIKCSEASKYKGRVNASVPSMENIFVNFPERSWIRRIWIKLIKFSTHVTSCRMFPTHACQHNSSTSLSSKQAIQTIQSLKWNSAHNKPRYFVKHKVYDFIKNLQFGLEITKLCSEFKIHLHSGDKKRLKGELNWNFSPFIERKASKVCQLYIHPLKSFPFCKPCDWVCVNNLKVQRSLNEPSH